jgi:N,N'-diacetyllegionaminate synthase
MVIKNLQEYGFNTKNRTYIIAEIGINHRGSVEVAKQLIDSAAKSGVDAVKFQTYITETRAPEGNQEVFNTLKSLELPFHAFKDLSDYADRRNVDFFSTPFDRESVEYLENIGMTLYKIASFDVTNHQLLNDVANTGKPVIMSVGMSSIEEIKEAYNILSYGTNKIVILHCVSSYPTLEKDSNLSNIYKLQESFDCIVGQSDHSKGIKVPLYAVAAGAQVIEKHFKIDEDFECVDSDVSITEKQMTKLVKEVRVIEQIFGEEDFGVRPSEKSAIIFRRN